MKLFENLTSYQNFGRKIVNASFWFVTLAIKTKDCFWLMMFKIWKNFIFQNFKTDLKMADEIIADAYLDQVSFKTIRFGVVGESFQSY